MSSIRLVLRATCAKSARWSKLSSSLGAVHSKNLSSTVCYQSGHKDNLAPPGKDVSANQETQEISKDSVRASSSEGSASAPDHFQEIFNRSRHIFSPRFGSVCHYRLLEYSRRVKQVEQSGKPVQLDNLLHESFSDVLEYSLTPVAAPEVRHSVFHILLSQPTDHNYLVHALQSTAADASQLPIASLAEIVRLLSVAAPTELRKKVQRQLVVTAVTKRWFEILPKHLVFFMFQIDELFPVRNLSRQLRERTKQRQEEEALKKKNEKGNKQRVSEATSESAEPSKGVASTTSADGGEVQSRLDQEKDEAEAFLNIVSVNLESRALTLADELKVKDLARVVSLLSRWGNRNEPLLNVYLHRLSLADLSDFTVFQLGSLLQAMAMLSLRHEALLENITKQLAQEDLEETANPSLVCGLLTSLSVLCWNGEAGDKKLEAVEGQREEVEGEEEQIEQSQEESSEGKGEDLVREDSRVSEGESGGRTSLISVCLAYLQSHQSKLTVREAAGVLAALAHLGAEPVSDAEQAFVKDLCSQVLADPKLPWWGGVQCAWCMAVLRCLDSHIAQSVLNPKTVEQVLEKLKGADSNKESSALITANKLVQVNLAAKLDVKDSSGVFLSEEQLEFSSKQPAVSAESRKAKGLLINTLRKFVDLATYIDLNPTLPKGVVADCVMCANNAGEVRPLPASVAGQQARSSEEMHLLAIQYIPFSSVINPQRQPTGPYKMNARHLSALGYVPVQILFSDLKRSLGVLERISNIKAKVKSSITAHTAGSAPGDSTTSGSSSTGEDSSRES